MGDTHGICRYSSDTGHDGDDDMLFNGERSRIKRDAKDGNIRQVTSPGFANRETQYLGDNLSAQESIQQRGVQKMGGREIANLSDGDGGESEEKELVDTGNKDGPNETDGPSTEGRRRHRWIICVGNGRTDFWIRRFILKRGSRWVKIRVVEVIDGDSLRICANSVSAASTSQPTGEKNKVKHH